MIGIRIGLFKDLCVLTIKSSILLKNPLCPFWIRTWDVSWIASWIVTHSNLVTFYRRKVNQIDCHKRFKLNSKRMFTSYFNFSISIGQNVGPISSVSWSSSFGASCENIKLISTWQHQSVWEDSVQLKRLPGSLWIVSKWWVKHLCHDHRTLLSVTSATENLARTRSISMSPGVWTCTGFNPIIGEKMQDFNLRQNAF